MPRAMRWLSALLPRHPVIPHRHASAVVLDVVAGDLSIGLIFGLLSLRHALPQRHRVLFSRRRRFLRVFTNCLGIRRPTTRTAWWFRALGVER